MCKKVSVIVPVYNAEKYLNRCVDSLISQSYTNLEIILVNDGSTDNSLSVCEEYLKKDERITLINQQNKGAGLARNAGLLNATGEYAVFVDSDDYLHNTAIEKCVNIQNQTKADLVMFGRFNQNAIGEITPKAVPSDKLYFEYGDLTDLLAGLFTYKRGIGISCWGKMYKLDIILGNGIKFYSERALLSEDAFFMLQLFAHLKSVAIISESLYYYCQNESSISRKYKKGRLSLCNAFLEKSLELCENSGYSEAVINSLKARYLMYVISGLKRVMKSQMTKQEKSQELKLAFCDKTLHGVIEGEVLRLLSPASRLFWRAYKLRLYWLCRILLLVKT